MKIGSLVMAVVLLTTGASMMLPAQAATTTSLYTGSIMPADVAQNPAWWDTPSGQQGVMDDRAVWLLVSQATGPYTVTVTSKGTVVAGLDVYKVHNTFDKVTPRCPQDHIERLYPDSANGEDYAHFGYLTRLHRMATLEHQTTVPATTDLEGTVSIRMDVASQDNYLFAIDARAGTGAAGATIDYMVESDDAPDTFRVSESSGPTSPPGFRLATWAGNSGVCQSQGAPIPPQPGTDAPALEDLPVSAATLFGTSL